MRLTEARQAARGAAARRRSRRCSLSSCRATSIRPRSCARRGARASLVRVRAARPRPRRAGRAGRGAEPRRRRGAGRFATVAERWRALSAAAVSDCRPTDADGAGPIAVGGFAFAANGGASPHWAGFEPASLIVPEVALVARRARRRAGGAPHAGGARLAR